MTVEQRLAGIKLLACDVDGTLTDGSITYGSGILEIKAFNIRDGLGLKLASWYQFPVVWLTGRTSDAVERRAGELNVQVYQGASDKAAGLRHVANDRGIALEAIAYIGDDINDLPALGIAGLPIAVADAAPEVLAVAAYVTKAPGGAGAVREALEYILRGQGRWEEAVQTYLSRLQGARLTQ